MHPNARQNWDEACLLCPHLLGRAALQHPPLQTFCSWVEKSSRKWLVWSHPPPYTPSKFLGVEKGFLQAFEPFLKGII